MDGSFVSIIYHCEYALVIKKKKKEKAFIIRNYSKHNSVQVQVLN